MMTTSGAVHRPSPLRPATNQRSVLFVLGGPGAGKGTQCARLAEKHCLHHLSVGDLLRAERDNPESKFAAVIAHKMKQGTVGPIEITVELLERAMDESSRKDGTEVFLIDGFQRKMDQLKLFETVVSPAIAVPFLDCPDTVRLPRLLARGKNNYLSRQDDDAKTIQERFATFTDMNMAVIEYLRNDNRLVTIDAQQPAEAVFLEVDDALGRLRSLRKR